MDQESIERMFTESDAIIHGIFQRIIALEGGETGGERHQERDGQVQLGHPDGRGAGDHPQ